MSCVSWRSPCAIPAARPLLTSRKYTRPSSTGSVPALSMQRGAGRIRSPGTDPFLFYIPGNGYQYSGPLGEVTVSVLIGLSDPGYEIIIIFVLSLSVITLFVSLIPGLNPRAVSVVRITNFSCPSSSLGASCSASCPAARKNSISSLTSDEPILLQAVPFLRQASLQRGQRHRRKCLWSGCPKGMGPAAC